MHLLPSLSVAVGGVVVVAVADVVVGGGRFSVFNVIEFGINVGVAVFVVFSIVFVDFETISVKIVVTSVLAGFVTAVIKFIFIFVVGV